MNWLSLIITIGIILFLLYLFCGASALSGKYKAIRSDEEIVYYIKAYPESHNISIYKDIMTYVFLHMDAIMIEFNDPNISTMTLSRVEDCFYWNNILLPKNETSTEKLWKFLHTTIEDYESHMYNIKILYSHEDINPSPIYKEGKK